MRQTSIKCYNDIKANGLLSKRRWEIYDIVYHHGPMTSNETFDYSSLKGVDGYRHNANARMTELRELGVVQELGTTKCSKTGRTVILWDVTSKMPVKSPKIRITKNERVANALNALRELYKNKTTSTDDDLKNVVDLINGI